MPSSVLRRRAVSLALASSLGTALLASAQTSKGILAGVARDSSGAVLANAVVTVKNQSTGETRMTKSAGDGAYRIEAISPGSYTVTTTEAGFNTSQVKDVVVQASVVTSYDITLQVGATSQEVTVEANQGEVDTDNGELSGTVTAEELDKVPVFSLNPVELALTVPGVQPVSNGNGAFSNGINIQVNGQRSRDNNYLMDGQEINDVGIAGQAFQPQIPDVFDSVTVITNSASAEYGRGSGGIVNLVTKQGTNRLHGELFERYTGSGLNSVPGQFRGSDFVKTRFDEHSFGFTVGGPIIKDKLFFFGAGEWQRYYGQEQPGVNLLPDAAGYATLQAITGPAAAQVAVFDQYLNQGAYLNQDLVYGSASGTPITSNVGALPGCPATGCIVSFAGFQRPNSPESSPDTQWMYRADYHPWERDSLSFRYLHDRTSLSPDFFNNGYALAGFDTQQGGPTEVGEGQWTHIFNPTILNEFRVSEARLSFTFSPEASTLANPLNALPTLEFGSLSGTTTAGVATFPNLGPNQNFPQGRSEDLYQFQDTVRITKGRESFSIGADIGRLLEIDLVPQNALGNLIFARGGSGVTSLGNFLQNQLGPSGSANKVFGPTRVDSHGWRNGFFVQDDVKLNAELTLNLGVRYDYLTNPENNLAYPGVNVFALTAPINTVTRIGEDYNNVAPRIGFAYSPHNGTWFGDGKTSIRGGFGVFYDSTFSNILTNTAQNSPVSVAATLTSTTGNGLANASGLLGTITPVLNPLSTVESEDSRLVNPVTYQYNLGVEREVPGQVVVGARYVGTRGEKEFANEQFNYFSGITGQRLNSGRGAIVLRGNYADSNYNALEITGRHNFKHGLLVDTNYVYSKDLDDGSEIFTVAGASPTSYSPNLSPNGGIRQNYGPSDFDHRHFFSITYVYQIPGLHSGSAGLNLLENVLTRHWTVSGTTQLQSGNYSSITTASTGGGLDINGDGSTTNDRPLLSNRTASTQSVGIDGHFVGGTQGVYYDLATLNGPGTLVPVAASSAHFLIPYFPNNAYLNQEIGRNTFLQPGNTTNNVALEKGFDFHERATLLLRAEAQNVANHNDLIVGDTNILDAGAGFLQPARAYSPTIGGNQRTLVLWAKLQF